ncbi:hypothetical protein CBS9595_000309 [Malassezia furfur]|nr:hypothetical protein CBS9595_000309 [Malassezia furfur]
MVYSGRVASASGMSSTAAMDSDLALAEMELMEQNQKRLASLTNRMTTILNGFDRRLVKLESSILPIHKSTQQLSQIHTNIEATKQELGKSLRHYGVVVDEEPLLLRGPSLRDPWPYLEAVQRVAHGIEQMRASNTKNPDQVLSKMETLLDHGARNVAELVREYTSAESTPTDLRASLEQHAALPSLSSECLMSVKALLQFLWTLRAPVAARAESPFSSALASYAQVRSNYCLTSIQPLVAHVTRVANMVQDPSVHAPREALMEYQRGSAGLQPWLQGLLELVENEYAITTALFEGMAWQHLQAPTFTRVVQPLVASVSSLLPTLLPRLQHGLHAHRMLVLDFLGASNAVLGADGQRWAQALQRGEDLPLDLPTAIVRTRQDAVRFFPEFLRDIKVIPVQREHDVLHTGVSDISRLGMQLVRSLVGYTDVLMSLLQTMHTKNWLDVDAAPQLAAPADAHTLFAEYLNDVLSAIVTSLERSVVAVPQPTVAALFLLNNLSYLQQELTQMHSLLPAAAVSSGDQLLKHAQRAARTSYLESWNSVVNALTEDAPGLSRAGTIGRLGSLGGAGRSQDTTARFFQQLAEKERIHRAQPLLQNNPALIESLRDDVVRYVALLTQPCLSALQRLCL